VSGLPRATIAVVNWNGRHLLEECLPSLAALDYPRADLEWVVIDNGSSDGSCEWLRARWPGVRLVAHGDNRGFAAAANEAAALAGGEVVAFVNNDCRVEATWLRRLVELLVGEGAAAVGSRILDWDGAHVDFDGAAMNFYGHGSHRHRGRPAAAVPVRPPEPALFACGGAMVVDRARFLAGGGFDAEYFAYYEDVDLGWRFWVQGERVLYASEAIAFHRHHGSGMEASRWRTLLERNALASLYKNYDDGNLAVVLPAARALAEARAALAADSEPYRAGMRAFDAALPALASGRAAVQVRRRRPDREIVPLFVEPFRPSAFGRVYWETQRRLVRELGVGRVVGDGAVAAAEGLGDFIDELQGRIEELQNGA